MHDRPVVYVCAVFAVSILVGVVPAQRRSGATTPAPAAAESPTSPDQITFTGRVIDAQGQPVGGTEVALYQMTYGAAMSSRKAELVTQQRIAADGAYSFSAPKQSDGYREGSIVARKEGLAIGWVVWRMRESEQADITLGEPQELAGIVVDQAGTPVGEAQVSVPLTIIGTAEDRRYLSFYVAPKIFSVTTGGSGTFVFPNMPADATFEFLVKKAGCATLCTFDASSYRGEKLQHTPGQPDIKLVLSPEATIEGIVTNKADGKGVGGVEVVAEPQQRGLPLPFKPATSADDGTFRLDALPGGIYTVQLVQPGEEAAAWVAQPVEVSVKTGETKTDVTLELTRGGVIEVLVKDGADGTPIEAASVNVRDTEHDRWLHGRTDESGVARIRVAPGPYSVSQAYKQGYTQDGQQLEVTVEEGQTKRVEWTLVSAPKISGTVRNEADDPAAGVAIEIKPHGIRDTVTTDAEGKYEITWDRSGWSSNDAVFVLVARDMDRNLATLTEIDEDTRHLDLTLGPACTFTGTVLDHENKALPDARVRVYLRVSNWGTTLGREEIKTRADGTFEAKAIPPEREYNVSASAEGFGKHDIQTTATNGPVNVGTFKLPLADLSLSGTVVDVNDEPVPNARIYFYGDMQPEYHDIRSDENGKFEIKGVCKGRINVNASTSGAGRLYGRVETEGGAGDVKIVVAERSTSRRRFVPRKPASLVGKPLPDLASCGIEVSAEDMEGKMLLLCFWDVNQRPSRHCIRQLAKMASVLNAKAVTVVAVQAAEAEADALEQWIEQYGAPFKAARMTGDIEKTRFQWGAASLPHLILTDTEHKVTAEGFSVRELEQKIQAASGG